MKKLMQYLKVLVAVIIVLETIVLAGCNTVNHTANINSSYDAIKTAYAKDPSNSEIAFIYDAINNQISEYPKTVPDFINLPIVSIIDAIGADERIHIDYANDDNYENGIIIAQEPKAGDLWDDGVVVNLTVNRKYSAVNSKWSNMSLSLDKLYLLSGYFDNDYNLRGTIWADEEKLIDGEITRIYAENGNVYYNDGNEVNRLNGESVLQVPGQERLYYAVMDEKIYYIDEEEDNEYNKLYCYNIDSKTSTLINEGRMLFIVSSDYIICWNKS